MKLLTLHSNGCPRTSLRNCSSSSLFTFMHLDLTFELYQTFYYLICSTSRLCVPCCCLSACFINEDIYISSIEPSLLLAPPLGTNSLLHSACYLRTMCLLSASFLRHFSLTVAGLRAPLSRFLEGVLYKYPE